VTYVIKCIWRATSLKLKIEALDAESALKKARIHRIGRRAQSYAITTVRR
jgi:hypothetical protein